MKKIALFSVGIYLVILACGPHPDSKLKPKPKKTRHQEVIIILSPYVDNYEHETLSLVEVEMEVSLHAWLTTTEDLLVRLTKAAQKVGANAITNLDIGSYDMIAVLPHESFAGRKHRIYARGTALVLKGFEGLPAPKTFARDRAHIRLQCNEYPPSRNVFILLSPFLERTEHQVIGPISVKWTKEEERSPVKATVRRIGEETSSLSRTEEMIQRLSREAAERGANAITNLDIGALFLIGYMYDEGEGRATHEAYAKALAIRTFPKKQKE